MPQQKGRVVYMNGKYLPEELARLSIFDTAIATNEKVVEVCRTYNHTIQQLREHLNRLYAGLAKLKIEIDLDPSDLEKISKKTLKLNFNTEPSNVDWQIIYYISKGPCDVFKLDIGLEQRPSLIVQCLPLHMRLGSMKEKYENGVDLVIVNQKSIPSDILPATIKSSGRLDHIIGRLEANEKKIGATGILLDENGFLTEGTGTSLFLVKNGMIHTARSSNVLDGMTRRIVMRLAKKCGIKLIERDIKPLEAKNADEIFITSTIIGLLHGKSIEGKKLGNGDIGIVTEKIRKAFGDEVGVDILDQSKKYHDIYFKPKS